MADTSGDVEGPARGSYTIAGVICVLNITMDEDGRTRIEGADDFSREYLRPGGAEGS